MLTSTSDAHTSHPQQPVRGDNDVVGNLAAMGGWYVLVLFFSSVRLCNALVCARTRSSHNRLRCVATGSLLRGTHNTRHAGRGTHLCCGVRARSLWCARGRFLLQGAPPSSSLCCSCFVLRGVVSSALSSCLSPQSNDHSTRRMLPLRAVLSCLLEAQHRKYACHRLTYTPLTQRTGDAQPGVLCVDEALASARIHSHTRIRTLTSQLTRTHIGHTHEQTNRKRPCTLSLIVP
jgi:hypothetical protein